MEDGEQQSSKMNPLMVRTKFCGRLIADIRVVLYEEKAPLSMVMALSGIVFELSEAHLTKAIGPMVVTFCDRVVIGEDSE